MSNQRRKNHDINLLSAYIDHALKPREQKRLEARLADDPQLRQKLNNLRRTKLALSRLTRLQAPRNFTLTPEMVTVRKPRRQPLQMTLRLASALAAILLVVLFGAEFILAPTRQPEMLAAEAPAAEAPAAEAPAMEAARVEDAEEPEPLIQWGPPNTGGEAGGMGGDSSAMEAPIMEMEAPEEEAPVEESPVEESPLPEDQPETFESPGEAEDPQEAATPEAKGDLILGINPDEGGEIITSSEPARAATEEAPQPWREALRWAQIALAAIALGGGLALLILRQRRRRSSH